ncbi:MAG TPA: hypothetical protein VGD00_07325 [Solirubrobacteraceae bacterium]
MQAGGSYSSLAAFYESDPVRARSREHDIGLWWRQEPGDPLHRAAWVCDTGELYLVRLGAPEQGGGRVELLATAASPDELERLLEGWRERCGEPRSLAWLRGRVRRRAPSQRKPSAARLRPA